jgi:hypothetical protein
MYLAPLWYLRISLKIVKKIIVPSFAANDYYK